MGRAGRALRVLAILFIPSGTTLTLNKTLLKDVNRKIVPLSELPSALLSTLMQSAHSHMESDLHSHSAVYEHVPGSLVSLASRVIIILSMITIRKSQSRVS